MKKKAVLAAVLVLTVVCTVAFISHGDPAASLLHPTGRIQVALKSYGPTGYARWEGSEPHVYDGSFSAALYTGTDSDSGGKILIGPLSLPLSVFTDSRITFWAYFYSSETAGYARPFINIVLDNGRWIEGESSTTMSGAAIKNEVDQGYRSADLWVLMKPSAGWYTSYPGDPALTAVSGCTLMAPCPLSTWQAAFPTAKVIQIQIEYGSQAPTGQDKLVFIDDVSIPAAPPFSATMSMTVPIEPETIAAADV
jgi:hypothetical protein